MRFNPKSLLLGLVYVLLAVFVWWNREVIFGYPSGLGEDPTALREALAARLPLVDLSQFTTGEVLLGFLGLLTLLYVLFAAGVRTSSLVELRRYAKEVEAARKLADEAEASRISGLQAHLDGLVASLREEAEARHNMLAATLGEMDERLTAAPGRAALPPGASDEPTA
ncbi:MAG: hypothetical protein H6648_07950 [Caldilineae bacterium]|nr:hypothetical protein [Chloroflexota bacterium]MCB9177077.1 hypothetical protein [Caldilineae bacterium]